LAFSGEVTDQEPDQGRLGGKFGRWGGGTWGLIARKGGGIESSAAEKKKKKVAPNGEKRDAFRSPAAKIKEKKTWETQAGKVSLTRTNGMATNFGKRADQFF